ncbi:MAG: hypothetical protein A2284_05990 [Deltaproteobacteria bacterium RIFOXYA12_FULL_61_11]|nr:MAG: hypothetical protein A2284_05990 [Deltaproteobacteria bacterium RIFOXYA12_FULL_61_11]
MFRSDRLAKILKEKEMSVLDLQRRSGVSAQHLHFLLSGKRQRPRPKTLEKIAQALEVEPGFLMDSNDIPRSLAEILGAQVIRDLASQHPGDGLSSPQNLHQFLLAANNRQGRQTLIEQSLQTWEKMKADLKAAFGGGCESSGIQAGTQPCESPEGRSQELEARSAAPEQQLQVLQGIIKQQAQRIRELEELSRSQGELIQAMKELLPRRKA